jgi:hypothetical protein
MMDVEQLKRYAFRAGIGLLIFGLFIIILVTNQDILEHRNKQLLEKNQKVVQQKQQAESQVQDLVNEIAQIQDFPTAEQGSFIGQTNNRYFKEPIDEIVVLFSSVKVPGLSLVYHPQENKLLGGTPQMVVDNVVLFDDLPHRVGYSFERNGKQRLLYDGQIVAESDFVFYANYLTGNAAGQEFFVSESLKEASFS